MCYIYYKLMRLCVWSLQIIERWRIYVHKSIVSDKNSATTINAILIESASLVLMTMGETTTANHVIALKYRLFLFNAAYFYC